MRLAWFSPLPPTVSGIAAYSAEILPKLADRGPLVETFDEPRAHEFVWRARRRPFDLTVYQLGNAACHDYMWAYMFRYPGLVVLHDAQLHQARALALTKRWPPRLDDYRAEFHANHPNAPVAIGDVIAAGLGESLYPYWPHIRLVLDAARLTVVHNARLAADLAAQYPKARVASMNMGVSDPLTEGARAPDIARAVRARHHVPEDALLVAAFGGITPEKRIRTLFQAVSAMRDRLPTLRLMLVGSTVPHYDVLADISAWGLTDVVRLAGFVGDEDLPAYLLAADVCSCLRWPTNRETSASWLRCLAAGRPTLVTHLADLGDVPLVDPRGWRGPVGGQDPVAVAIDLVDERQTIQLALERLAMDATVRHRLGEAARAWWYAHHRLDLMAEAYERVMTIAAATPVPRPSLPSHLRPDVLAHARALATPFNVADRVSPTHG
ncbi:MAG: glycosyltransferase family 4 protein [Acidobacteriota bacterium]